MTPADLFGRLALPLLLSAECSWVGASESTKELHVHSLGNTEQEAHQSSNHQGAVEVAIGASGSLGNAMGRRMMRAEKLQERDGDHQQPYQLYQEMMTPVSAMQQLHASESVASAPGASTSTPRTFELEPNVNAATGVPQIIVTPAPVPLEDAINASLTVHSQDCRWYDWSPWSYCSKSCAGGWQSRKRTIALAQMGGGKKCAGETEEFNQCNKFECPIDCEWGSWSDWSHCTASCDGGTRQRGMPIKIQNNSLGKPCNAGDGVQLEDCATTPCVRDCKWGEWQDWGSCTASCAGGVKKRIRSAREPAVHGGKKCEGTTQDEEICNIKACPTDCVMSDWGQWDLCSETCGSGSSVRKRAVQSKEESGGQPCPGPFLQESRCFVQPCAVNCVWADWASWSTCSATCGGNASSMVTSSRKRAVMESAGGLACAGEDTRIKACGQTPCPVACQWAEWGEWQACNRTCGGGSSVRQRNFSVAAAHGGLACVGDSLEAQPCSPQLCPVNCRLSDWQPWSECSKFCGNGTALRYRWETVPAARGGQACADSLRENGPCTSTDCVSSEELIRKGYATQVTGAMQVMTEDPVSFSSDPLVEQVAKEAISEYAALPVRRVHVAMMPAVHSLSDRDVNCWFSLLVPNSTNLTEVVENLANKELVQAGKVLRHRLQRVGEQVLVNITKLFLTSKGTTTPSPSEAPFSNETEPNQTLVSFTHAPATTHPNASRITGVMKMIVSNPLKFAEDTKATEASEFTLAELSGMSKSGVHASLIPDQVLSYANEQSEQLGGASLLELGGPSFPSDSSKNVSGEVDAWFSIIGEVWPDRRTAIIEGRKIARAMMAEDLKDVTLRMNAYLDQTGLPDAYCKVILITAKADGDTQKEQEEEQEAVTPTKRVTGVMELVTSTPKTFAGDRRSEEALTTAVAQLVGLEETHVRVSLMPSMARATVVKERLGNMSSPSPEAVANGEMPPATPAELNEGYADEVFVWFVITVAMTTPDAADEVAEKMRNQDLTLASVRVQNDLMDAGMDAIVHVARITVQVQRATTTLAPGVIKKVSDIVPQDVLLNKTSVDHDDIADAVRTVLDSSVVPGESVVPPARVVAVVANVKPVNVEPPTVSNPGGGDDEVDDALQAGASLVFQQGKQHHQTDDPTKMIALEASAQASSRQPSAAEVRSEAAGQRLCAAVMLFLTCLFGFH